MTSSSDERGSQEAPGVGCGEPLREETSESGSALGARGISAMITSIEDSDFIGWGGEGEIVSSGGVSVAEWCNDVNVGDGSWLSMDSILLSSRSMDSTIEASFSGLSVDAVIVSSCCGLSTDWIVVSSSTAEGTPEIFVFC